MNEKDENHGDKINDADRRILLAVRSVRYGSVEITIHDGRVVQVERREKIRLNHEGEAKSDAR